MRTAWIPVWLVSGERAAGHAPSSFGSNLSASDKAAARIVARGHRNAPRQDVYSEHAPYSPPQVPPGRRRAGGRRRAVRRAAARPGPDAPGRLGLRARRAGRLRLPADAAARRGQLRLQAAGRAPGAGHPGQRHVRQPGRQLAGRLAAAGQPRLLRLQLQLRRALGVVGHPGHRGHRRLGGAAGLVREQGARGDRRGQGRPGGPLPGRHDAAVLPEVPRRRRLRGQAGRAGAEQPRTG